ncbi:MAG: sigma-70 family RNA polymerase sigma factor [Puia sp.]|nr:sigma-70 family RNA polymerase sigma factor [Puia sp.]
MNKDPFIHITDQELLDRYYSERNNDWLGVLLERYTLLLLGVCMKYLKNEEEAKDGVQQVFLKIIAELPRYKVTYFKSWIYTITRNYCLMKLRDRHEKIPAELTESMAVSYDEEPPGKNHLEKDQLLELMTESLEELGKEQKLCVTLFYLEKRSYQDIAELTKFTLMQVKSHIQNGKRNLKLSLEKKRKR